MWDMLSMIFTTDLFFSVLRITAPILLATLAALICEKAGISNIGLEGTMMIAALAGSLGAYYSGIWLVGLILAIVAGMLVSAVMGFFAFNLKTDIILTGTAINMLGSGGTLFLIKVITGWTEGQQYASTNGMINQGLQIPTINIPLLKDIPYLGEIFSGHSLLTYVTFILVFLVWVMLYKTPLGLNIRSVGENPNAASSVGISITRIHYVAIILAGALAGMGGAFMSMYYAIGWSLDMVAGRGFIALAACAMGNNEPVGGMFASLIFGFAQAVGIKFSAVGVDSNLVSPIPYIVTILGLVIFAVKSIRKAKRKRAANALEDKGNVASGKEATDK